MELLREVSDQHLTCSICMDLYKDPKQLPCLHSFCRKCLCTHILKTVGVGGSLSFFCPICRKVCKPEDADPNKVLSWVESFPDNFYICSLLDTLEAQQREVEARPIHERLQDTVVEPETCPKHRTETVVSFCIVRNVGVCPVCLKSSVHDECAEKHMSPEGARSFAGTRLKTFKSRIANLSERVAVTEDKIASRPSELKFKNEELAIEISQFFSDLRTNINKMILEKEKDALGELKHVMKDESAKLSSAKDEMKSLSGSLKSTEQLLDKLLENQPVGALSVADSIETQIAEYEKMTCKIETDYSEVDIVVRKREDIAAVLKEIPWGWIHVGGEKTKALPCGSDIAAGAKHKAVLIDDASSTKNSNGTFSQVPSMNSCQLFPSIRHERGASEVDSSVEIPVSTVDSQTVQQSLPNIGGNIDGHMSHLHGASVPNSVSFLANQTVSVNQSALKSLTVAVAPTGSDRGFSITSTHEFNGLCQEDVQNASYVGACPHGQNCLVILDRWNKKLKVFQIRGRMLFFMKFTDSMEPWDVTRVTEESFAVTCPSQCRLLEIVLSGTTLSVSRIVTTPSGYSALVHLHGNVFAAGVCKPFGSPHVDILDASSSQAVIIMPLSATVTYPRTLDLTIDRNFFICDWSQKELLIFDTSDFHQLLRYKGTGREAVLREPVSVAKDRAGHLYILDRKTKRVYVLSPSTGAMLSVLELGLQCDPKVVVIVEAETGNSPSGEVLVVAAGNGKIYVYALVHP